MVILRLQAHLGEEMLKQITASDNAVEGTVNCLVRFDEELVVIVAPDWDLEEDT